MFWTLISFFIIALPSRNIDTMDNCILFARPSRKSSETARNPIAFCYYVVIAFCAVYILRIARVDRIVLSRILFYRDASRDLSQRWLFAKFIRGFSHNTVYCRLFSALFRWKIDEREFESQLLAYAAPRRSLESTHRSIPTKSHLFPNIRHAPSCPQEWRIPEAIRDPEINLTEEAHPARPR